MRERLDEYTPEAAAEICNLNAEDIRILARKIATLPTNILGSLNQASKHYHGDLIERSQILLLALTGNWGKHGTGMRAWSTGYFDGMLTFAHEDAAGSRGCLDDPRHAGDGPEGGDDGRPDFDAEGPCDRDRSQRHDGRLGVRATCFPVVSVRRIQGRVENAAWHDSSMTRPFKEYFDEAVESGWWAGADQPHEDRPPRVLIECGGNVLRRTRGGAKMLLEHFWPQLKMIVTMDVRMSATAAYSDIVLPMAQQYEKIGFGIPTTHVMNLTFCDKAVEPPDECLDEWEAFRRIAEKLEERGKERGSGSYSAKSGAVFNPKVVHTNYTSGGLWLDQETIIDEMLRDTALVGTIPADASLDDVREKGFYRWESLGITPRAVGQATDPSPTETFVPFRKHVEDGEPYPTYSRRSQFLIDHPWFIEADEHLPRHKEPPAIGGNHPFQVSSGHNRWSIHSLNTANSLMLETHRGQPHIVINENDAAELGIVDNDLVRVWNDAGEFRVAIKTSNTARPKQVVMYNGFDNYQFPDWAGPNDAEPGMIKWLHLAGGYGHLKYWVTEWQPCTTMRNTRVSIEKA